MPDGWFEIPGVQSGFRTLDEQLQGLEGLAREAEGQRVLDLGCAEGLILRHLLEQGAAYGFGVDCNATIVHAARQACAGLRADFLRCDLNGAPPALAEGFDVVLLLAILHKLKRPEQLIDDVLLAWPALIVVRLPPHTPGFVRDARSDDRHIPIASRIQAAGYELEERRGPREEWVGVFRKAMRAAA